MSTSNAADPTQGLKPLKARLGKIGLGCVTFGREIDEASSFAMMDHALARGVNLFDSAAAYGAGASERIIGAWLASRRPAPGSVVVATKMRAPFTPELLEQSIAQSRERLGVATIDLFYLHQWNEAAADPAVLSALDRAVKAGRLGALGVSNFSAEQLERVLGVQKKLEYARFEAVQNNHNFAVRTVDERLWRLCEREGVAVVTYSPLGAGFLTGKHKAGVAKGSRFEVIPGHQPIYFNDDGWRRLARLEEVAARRCRSMPELALAWVLRQGDDIIPIPGTRREYYLMENIAATRINLSPADLRELTDVIPHEEIQGSRHDDWMN